MPLRYVDYFELKATDTPRETWKSNLEELIRDLPIKRSSDNLSDLSIWQDKLLITEHPVSLSSYNEPPLL